MRWRIIASEKRLSGVAELRYTMLYGKSQLNIFVDRGILEVYCNGVAVTHKCFSPADEIEVFAFSEGADVTLKNLNAWKMKSMWE